MNYRTFVALIHLIDIGLEHYISLCLICVHGSICHVPPSDVSPALSNDRVILHRSVLQMTSLAKHSITEVNYIPRSSRPNTSRLRSYVRWGSTVMSATCALLQGHRFIDIYVVINAEL